MSFPVIRRGQTNSPQRKSSQRLQPVNIPSLHNKVEEITREHANIKLMQSFLQGKSKVRLSPLKNEATRRVRTEI
jgi:hypothetical protein